MYVPQAIELFSFFFFFVICRISCHYSIIYLCFLEWPFVTQYNLAILTLQSQNCSKQLSNKSTLTSEPIWLYKAWQACGELSRVFLHVFRSVCNKEFILWGCKVTRHFEGNLKHLVSVWKKILLYDWPGYTTRLNIPDFPHPVALMQSSKGIILFILFDLSLAIRTL